MTAEQQDKRRAAPEAAGPQQRSAAIGGHVLRVLGQPGALHAVQVRQLWGDHYRVNVLVGADASSVRVAHSYFLVTDGDGNVLVSTPSITRQY
ncbi:MAG TPA: hypothetical protein VFE78_34070 [Gemmataceae bacterium]|jgi:hypothetical protein|nr:hypothetical protein [Gemmataceae bacterium]